MAEQQLPAKTAEALRADVDLETLSYSRAAELLERQPGIQSFAPGGTYAVDPRSGEVTLFNERRARRPQDYGTSPAAAGHSDSTHGVSEEGSGAESRQRSEPCKICNGETTAILDLQPLSDGFTFINENLYPVAFPGRNAEAYGLHFLQWTSSYHDRDWPELTAEDRLQVLTRLSMLERQLLTLVDFPDPPSDRHVSIIKNVGKSVGGSLSHGHQQIVLSNVAPRRVHENRRFGERFGTYYSSFMMKRNPSELTVAGWEHGRLMVPYFMRRPYDMQFVLSDPRPQYLHDMTVPQLKDMGGAIATGMRLMRSILAELGREVAYNIVFHTGPGAGIYLEFLPFTQENGGFEQLGLSVCQGAPAATARTLREAL
jgi:galactose-1-phosphate uridylyltransferase